MPLDEEIKQKRQEISTDSYAMSVGEMISLYKNGELNLRPEFQRFFRWGPSQKSRFIESLLLNIPVPPVFVSQDEMGRWDVIDGLQRLSTVLELTGDLRDESGNLVPPLTLLGTKYLPSLNGKQWNADPEGQLHELEETTKLFIKRARIDLKIVLNSSDPASKFELFDRLNTGGSAATDQEVRNCLLIMINKPFFGWMSALGNDENFKTCLPITERQVKEQFNLELVVRFLTLRTISDNDLANIVDLGPFLTSKIMAMAQSENFPYVDEESSFRNTFELLAKALGEDSFRKFDHSKGRATGAPLISGFEVMALGVGYNVSKPDFQIDLDKLRSVHQQLWENPNFVSKTGSGIRATSRLPITIPFGRQLFAP